MCFYDSYPVFWEHSDLENPLQHQTSTTLLWLLRENPSTLPLSCSRCCVSTSTPKPRAEGSSPSAPAKNGEVSRVLTSPFFVSVPNVLATRHGCALRSACRGGLQPSGLRPGPTEPAGETSPSLHFHHVMEELPSLSLLYSVLSHPASSIPNRCYPLQHPERTRFRPFGAFPGAFRHFWPLLTHKISGLFFVHLAA